MRKLVVVVALLGLVACGNDKTNDTAATATTAVSTRFGTTDVSTPEATEQDVLTGVTVGRHDGFVRVVFRFANLVPGYSVKKAGPPFVQDGSGAEVQVSGNGHLELRLVARAHDDQGNPTVTTKRIAGPANTSLTEVVSTGDFEGIVNYVIGTTEAKDFAVFTLASPPRLVIDVRSP